MVDLVKYDKGNVFCDSLLVAKKFSKEHNYVVRKIKKLIEEIEENKHLISLDLKFKKTTSIYRGQKFNSYLLNREAFSLLCMKFSGKKALVWQAKFNSAFYEMEKYIIKSEQNKNNLFWKEQREQSKITRREETDVIKKFVEYAKSQGSTKASYYYKHLTKATYKALQFVEHNKPKIRETLDLLETAQLVVAESIVKKRLSNYMEQKEHYKVIYELIKQDLQEFAKSLFLTTKQYLNY